MTNPKFNFTQLAKSVFFITCRWELLLFFFPSFRFSVHIIFSLLFLPDSVILRPFSGACSVPSPFRCVFVHALSSLAICIFFSCFCIPRICCRLQWNLVCRLPNCRLFTGELQYCYVIFALTILFFFFWLSLLSMLLIVFVLQVFFF